MLPLSITARYRRLPLSAFGIQVYRYRGGWSITTLSKPSLASAPSVP